VKLVTYQSSTDQLHLGVLLEKRIINLHQSSNGELPDDMRAFLELGEPAMQTAKQLLTTSADSLSLETVTLKAPIYNPSKIIAIGLNYMDHVRESGMKVPELATMFCKYPSAIVGSEEAIRWQTTLTQQVDYEAELAVVIGKTANRVSEADAYDYIAGYTNCNDVSARDLQFKPGDQWLRGKCLDSFCPIGPYLVTADEIRDPHDLSIQCRVNGEALQDSNTGEMIYKIPYLIEYLSEAFTLLPGDIIITGTPHGVGAFRKPPIWLKQGDEVIVEIEGLGQLRNICQVDS